MNANAELTLRKRLNAQTNPKKKGGKKKPAQTKKTANDHNKSEQKKKPTTKKKKNKTKPTAASKDDSGQDCDAAEEQEEEEQADKADDGANDEVRKEPSGSKKANRFSLKTAQMMSMKKTKAAQVNKRPATTANRIKKEEDKQGQKKKDQPKKGDNKGGDGGRNATAGTPENEGGAGDRKKERNRITSWAYHKKLDELKPKKKYGFEPGSKEWTDKMNKAKEAARAAHSEAGQKFDLENPKEERNDDDNEEKSRAKQRKVKSEPEETWTKPRDVD